MKKCLLLLLLVGCQTTTKDLQVDKADNTPSITNDVPPVLFEFDETTNMLNDATNIFNRYAEEKDLSPFCC